MSWLGFKARALLAAALIGGAWAVFTQPSHDHPTALDGDTFVQDGIHYRLTGIDAPELPGHCRRGRACVVGKNPWLAKAHLQEYLDNGVSCVPLRLDYYGRTLVSCTVLASGASLSGLMVANGDAEVWPHA